MRINKITSVSAVAVVALTFGACGGGSEASEAEICDSLEEIASFVATSDGSDENDALDEFVSRLEAFAEVAPDEVKDDADKLVEGTKNLQEAVSDGGEPSDEELEALDDEEYDKASDSIEDYAQKTCDVDLA